MSIGKHISVQESGASFHPVVGAGTGVAHSPVSNSTMASNVSEISNRVVGDPALGFMLNYARVSVAASEEMESTPRPPAPDVLQTTKV
jgi:hypothetical protein